MGIDIEKQISVISIIESIVSKELFNISKNSPYSKPNFPLSYGTYFENNRPDQMLKDTLLLENLLHRLDFDKLNEQDKTLITIGWELTWGVQIPNEVKVYANNILEKRHTSPLDALEATFVILHAHGAEYF